jgi:hypothetical protein
MRYSRRKVIGFSGAAITLLSGCTVSGVIGTDDTSRFEARLSGPGTDRVFFDKSGVSQVSEIKEQNGSFALPVKLTEDATDTVRNIFQTVGVTHSPSDFEIILIYDDDERNRFGVAPELAEKITSKDWAGEFQLIFRERQQAANVRDTLT